MKKLSFILLLCLTASVFGQFQQKPMLGEQIEWSKPISKGLVLYLPFNEGSGNTVFDLSGNGNTGILQGTAPSWTSGKFGSAVLLPGTDEYISFGTGVTDIFDFQRIDPFSIGAWVYSTNLTSTSVIIANYSRSSRDGWYLYLSSTLKLGFNFSSLATLKYNITSPDNSILENQWYHVFVTYDGSENVSGLSLYINGVSQTITIADNDLGVIDYSAVDLEIGRRDDADNQFYGLIDHIPIYNRALSAGEIAKLYREPFCMFQQDIPLMAVEAPVPGRGQVIMITSLPVLFIGLYLCRKYKAA